MSKMQSHAEGQAWGSVDPSDNSVLTVHLSGDELNEEIFLQDVIAAVPAKNQETELHAPTYRLLSMQRQNDAEKEAQFGLKTTLLTSLPASFLDRFLLSSTPKHLSIPKDDSGNPNIHVVVSIRSGACHADPFFTSVVQPLLAALGLSEHDYELHRTTSDRSIMEFATRVLCARANAGVSQTVLLLSGDGGIIDIVNGLETTPSAQYVKPSIGILVLGTGNALANSSGLNNDSTKGLATLLRGIPQSIPTFITRFSPGSEYLIGEGYQTEPLAKDDHGDSVVYGAVVCSWALHASLVADSNTIEYREYGTERFSMAANELLHPSDGSQPHSYHGRITLLTKNKDGTEGSTKLGREEHMYILATLVSNLEQTLTISPRSKPLDGQLRVLHFGNMPSSEVIRILGLAFAGGMHIQDPAVCYEDIEGMRIDFEEPDAHWRRVCVDGKIIRVDEGGWLEIRRGRRDIVDLIANVN